MSVEDVPDINETQPEHEDEENFMNFVDDTEFAKELSLLGDETDFLYYDELLNNQYNDFDQTTSSLTETTNNNKAESERADGTSDIQINKLVDPDLSFYNDNNDENVERIRSKSTKRKQLTCNHCGYITKYKKDFKIHSRNHIINTNDYTTRRLKIRRIEEYKCDECQYTTDRKDSLTQHMTVHKRIVIKLKLNFESTKGNNYKCDQCNFTTKHWKDFKLHIPKHNPLNGRVYKCDFCDFTTKWRQNLKPHIETHKSCGEVEYKCDRCTYTTTLKRYLTQHYQQHKSSKQYKCRQCGFSTNWSKHLKQHIEVHNSSKAYQCADCGFTTNSKRNLQIHFKKYGGLTSHAKLKQP